MNLSDLIARANATETLNVTNEILVEAAKAREAEVRANAVHATKGLLATFEQTMKQNVYHLRELRRQEKECAALVKKLDNALHYFGDTGNPLPFFRACGVPAHQFCCELGIATPAKDDPAWEVPADYTPSV